MRVFEVLFKAVSTGFGLRTIEKYLENPHFIFCSVFQNLRLETIMLLQKNIRRSSMLQCMLVVFCKPILAILLQRKRRIARMHLACISHASRMLVVFCKHIPAILLQRKYQTIINASCLFADGRCRRTQNVNREIWTLGAAKCDTGLRTFQGCEYWIYTNRRKVLRNRTEMFARPSNIVVWGA